MNTPLRLEFVLGLADLQSCTVCPVYGQTRRQQQSTGSRAWLVLVCKIPLLARRTRPKG